jgi:phosphoribosylformylglycinamidine (FGAM) synthase PurS component
MTGVEILVRLATADPWSFTVLDTLRRKLGLSEVVGVVRMKAWRLGLDADAEAALAIVDRLLSETALLANPNRDSWCIREVRENALPQNLWRAQRDALDAYVIKVADREDLAGRSLLRVLNSRLGITEAKDAGFSSVWIVETAVGEPRSAALAAEVAVSRSWRRGLLSNPHYQDAEVVKAEAYLPYGVAP